VSSNNDDGFMNLVRLEQENETKQTLERDQAVSRARSLVSAPVRGVTRTSRQALDEVADFVQSLTDVLGIGETFREAREGAMVSPEEFEEGLEEQLPVQEGFLERALERAGEVAPTFAGSGLGAGGSALRALLMGAAGQGAEEVGLGQLGQAVAEIGAAGIPALGKTITPGFGRASRRVIEEGRRLGLTEQQIAPLVSEERRLGVLGKGARKGKRVASALEETKKGLASSFDHLRTLDVSNISIPAGQQKQLFGEVQKILEEVPQKTRNAIQEDLGLLFAENVTGSKIINFWQKLNSLPKDIRSRLGRIKEPLQKQLGDLSPELLNDFKVTNELFGRYAKVRKALAPSGFDDFMKNIMKGEVIGAVVYGSPAPIATLVGHEAARSLASEMLVNPRFQNLSRQIVSSLNQGKIAIANRAWNQLSDEVREISPELSSNLGKNVFADSEKEIQELSEEQFQRVFE